MQYLNLPLQAVRAPEYVGSSPVERGTWLNVLAYCCDQENGGKIAGAALWKDRQWQQTCGVTMREVKSATRLLAINGEDVIVHGYPSEKEDEVKARRIQAADAARRRWAKRLGLPDQPAAHPPTQSADDASRIAPRIACGDAPRNAEENGREEKVSTYTTREPSSDADIPSEAEVIAEGDRLNPVCPPARCVEWLNSAIGRGWRDGADIPIHRWRNSFRSAWGKVSRAEAEKAALAASRLPQGHAAAGARAAALVAAPDLSKAVVTITRGLAKS